MLYPTALEAGISVFDFWEMTYGEIVALIKAKSKQQRQQMQWQASVQYNLANLIGVSVGRLFDDGVKFPPINEAFPDLFDDIINKNELNQTDWRIMKERIGDYAVRWNESHPE